MEYPDKKYWKVVDDLQNVISDLECIKKTGWRPSELDRPEDCREHMVKREKQCLKDLKYFCKVLVANYSDDFLEGIECE